MAASRWCVCGPFRISLIPRGLLKPVILSLLAEKPMHGFELMEEVARRTGGMWRPGPGAMYPALLALEEGGYVAVQEEGPRAKKPYAVTPTGREAIKGVEGFLQEWEMSVDRLGSIWHPQGARDR